MVKIHPKTQLISSYLAAFSSGDADTVASHVTDDFKNEHFGMLGKGCQGKATYRERLEGFLSSFENLSYTIKSTAVDGDQGAACYEMRFMQAGKSITVKGMMWFTFRDGLIAKRTDCWDSLTYFKQTNATAEDIAGLL